MRKLVLYSRPECHLCEALHADLAPLIAGRAMLEIVDITGDEGLERRYGLRIPVLVEGESQAELSSYPLDRERVRTYLDAR